MMSRRGEGEVSEGKKGGESVDEERLEIILVGAQDSRSEALHLPETH